MNKEKIVKPEAIFKYADKYARRHEAAGNGTRYPTVRQAARRFKVPQSVIRGTVEGAYIEGTYFALATALGIPGVGAYELAEADHQIEAYRDE